MPEMTGVDLGNEIKKISENAIIIFTTTSRSHAIEAFELSALSYLVKPFTKDKLVAAITKAVNVYNQNNLKSIVIKTTDGMKKVAIKDIMYVEADKHYQIFYLTEETVMVRSTISSVWDSLKNDMRFIQPHASFIVNMDYISRLDGDDIELTNKERLPISKQMKGKVKQAYLDYMFVR
jgi:DNA-binding LytR/AlgR family response regulator